MKRTLTKQIAAILICCLTISAQAYAQAPANERAATTIGGVELGRLTDYLFFFADGNTDLNWQGATKGFVGDVAVDGVQASERTSGSWAYAGTIYTNDTTLDAWADIVDNNDSPEVSPSQAFGSTDETYMITDLEADLDSAFAQINALPATTGFSAVDADTLDGWNTQDSIAETYVINIVAGLTQNSPINITGDEDDVYIFRWDDDGIPTNGYQGQVKFSGGGGLIPLGDLQPSNFINVAGEIRSSGGGSNPASPYPQGPRHNNGSGDLITGGVDFNGGGFFTGYWLTTGNDTDGENTSLSNAIFVGGWYTTATKLSMTSGTSGVHVAPKPLGADQWYSFDWNYGAASGLSWDLTNGEASITRSVSLPQKGSDTIDVDVTLSNPDGVNIDSSNCGASTKIYTATCDASFADSPCGGSYDNYGCGYLTLGMSAADTSDLISMTFDFDTAVQVMDLTLSDIDFMLNGTAAQTWHDGLEITADLDGIAVPIEYSYKGSEVLVSGNESTDFKAYARAIPGVDGDISETAREGALTINTMGLVNSLTITMKNAPGDDGESDGLGVRISPFNIYNGAPNQMPIAERDTFQVRRSVAYNGNVLDDNGYGEDFKGDPATTTCTKLTDPSNGSLVLNTDGTFTYTPDAGFIGVDSFTYEIEDANGDVSQSKSILIIKGFTDADLTGDLLDIDDDDDGVLDVMETCGDTAIIYTELTVEVITDGQPFEIAWEMEDPYGSRVESVKHGEYDQQEQVYNKNMQVIMQGKYNFTIRDLYGDGLTDADSRVAGSFLIKKNGATIYTGIPGFGHRSTVEIEITDDVFTCKTGDPSADNDGDNIINFRDSDYCTLNANGVCADMDTDGDGVPDFIDLDSDNDGIPDNVEVQKTQGFIDPIYVDSDKDGLDDAYDQFLEGARASLASEGIIPVDTDADGTPDYLDLDSDDDFLPDSVESGLTKLGADADLDGLDDGIDVTADYRTPAGLIIHTIFLPDEDGDAWVNGGDVDFRDLLGGPLPVELLSFTAEASGNNATLNWRTASEVNNEYFSLQRSADALTWQEIGIIEGHGTSANAHNYQFTDKNLEAGRCYYRLQQFDYDGSSDYSGIESVLIGNMGNKNLSLNIFPNPARITQNLTVEGLGDEVADIRLYSSAGSEVSFQKLEGNQLDLSRMQLHSGIYYLEVLGETSSASFQLVVSE